jgi:hypothetical protein
MGDTTPNLSALLRIGDGKPKHRSAPLRRMGHAEQHLDGCSFARSIAAQKSSDLVPRNIQVYSANSLDASVVFGQMLSLDHAIVAHFLTLLSRHARDKKLQLQIAGEFLPQ